MVGETKLANASLVAESKASKVLNGYLVPKRDSNGLAFLQLNSIYTSVINDGNNQSLALAAILKFSPGQAYCFLSQVNPELRRKLLKIDAVNTANGHHNEIQIEKIEQEREVSVADEKNVETRPLYLVHKQHKRRTPLEHILNAVVEQALGVTNLEKNKNVTIDLMASDDDVDLRLWRDRLGFCVSDRHEFVEITVDTDHLLSAINAEQRQEAATTAKFNIHGALDATYTPVDLHIYDQTVTALNRAEYLSFLHRLKGARSSLARRRDDTSVCGTAMALDTTVMSIYADDTTTALALFRDTVQQQQPHHTTTTFTVVKGGLFDGMRARLRPTSVKDIERFHTTAIPTAIDWSKVYVANVGMHLL